MSVDFTSVPIIDVSGLFSTDLTERKKVAAELGEAARTAGFLYVTGHNVPEETIDGLYDAARDFFALPPEVKTRYDIAKSSSHKGYVPKGAEFFDPNQPPDNKEAFDVGFEVPPNHEVMQRKLPLLGPNEWPTEVPSFHERVAKYYDAIFELGAVLLRGFSLALGLPENYFDNKILCPLSKLRLVHYFFDPNAYDDKSIGISPHTDYEMLTILESRVSGLEAMNAKGEWIDIPPVKGAFVVNLGDMMENITAGVFVATTHRVRRVAEERFSFPLFCSLDFDTVIEPLPQFVAMQKAKNIPTEKYGRMELGKHLVAQTLLTYSYLQDRLDRNELQLPEGAHKPNTFGNLNRSHPSDVAV